jgi:MFS family permease
MSEGKGLRNFLGFMRGNIAVLTVTQFLDRFFRGMVTPYTSLYVLALGGASTQIGVINSLRPIAGLVVYPLAGYFTDRTGRVKLITLAGYLQGATMFIYALAPRWEWIAFAAFLRGFMVFNVPPTSAIIADSLAPENRGVGIATMTTIASVLGVFSPYIAGMLLELYGTTFGMRVLYALLASANIVSATIKLRYLEETAVNRDEKITTSNLSQVLRDAYGGIPSMLRELPNSVRALGVVIILTYMANGIASPFWVVYAVERIGLSSVEWGLIFFLASAMRVLISIPAGILVDRHGRTKSLMVSLCVSLISIPSFVLARGFMDVLLIRLAVTVANALFTPACSALMADSVPREKRGRVMAAFGRGSIRIGAAGGGTGGPGMGFLITIPVMIASIVGGVLYAVNPIYPWVFVLFSSLVSILVSWLFIRDPKTAET